MKTAFSIFLVFTSFVRAVYAEPACTQELAIQKYQEVYSGAIERFQAEEKPAKLEKKKIGFVLVAQAAPGETDRQGLQADLIKLANSLQLKSSSVCREADRIRSKHGL